MPYTTQAALIDRFGEEELLQLADRDGDGVIDTAVVDQAITDADAEIDGYLGAGGYTVPLDPAPTVIASLSADITRYRLHDDLAPPAVRTRYEDARRMLEAIAAGRVSLGANDATGSAGSPEFEAPGRVFSRSTLEDF